MSETAEAPPPAPEVPVSFGRTATRSGDGRADPLLEVRDLHTHYPVRRSMREAATRRPRSVVRAVDGVSLSLARGEMLALVGESGCGKTTTAQSVLGMVAPTSGSIRVNGTDIAGLTARRMRPFRRAVQMIYQDPYESLDQRFRVWQTVEEPLLVHGLGGSRAERRRHVDQALERVGLSPAELFADRYPHELSGGQRQRVAIAASLVLGPELLLADEPVSMLDVSVRAGVLSLLDSLRRETDLGILMITHDLSTAAHFADRIAVMYLGRVIEQGPADQVVHDPQHPYTKALLSVVPTLERRQGGRRQILTGETPDPVRIPPGCRFHPRCPVAVEACRTSQPELRPVGAPEADHEAACLLAAPPG